MKMDLLKKLFPLSFREKKDVGALIINILIHVVADVIAGLIIGLLSNIAIVGAIFTAIGSLIGIYFTAGIVLSILHYIKVLK